MLRHAWCIHNQSAIIGGSSSAVVQRSKMEVALEGSAGMCCIDLVGQRVTIAACMICTKSLLGVLTSQ